MNPSICSPGMLLYFPESATSAYVLIVGSAACDADNADVTMDIDSLQLSYSMGAASIRLQDSDASNANYTTGTDEEHTELNISLSF